MKQINMKSQIFRPLAFVLAAACATALVDVNGQSVPAGFNDAVVVSGFTEPVGFTFDANGRLYVWEKAGRVWIVENGVKQTPAMIDISEEVGNWRDHGFLGFALDPDFLSNGYIYLLYTVDRHYLMNYGTPQYNPATNEYYAATIMRLTRYTAVGANLSTVDLGSRHILIGETKETGIPLLHESHSTGSLVFATDGTLMLSAGDGASYTGQDLGSNTQTYYATALADGILRPEENVGALRAQMINSMNGKLMRIDPATGDGVPSNPFYDASAPHSPRSRVWALGLRNPYRFTLRPGTGSTDPSAGNPGAFYIGDVGMNTYEEMNVCYIGGMNFGWPLFEGMDAMTNYMAAKVPNPDAPNPLYGQGNCDKPFFDFQDLIIQETLNHPTGLPNPCDPGQLVPPNVPVFTHSRPVVDWLHGNRSRCSAFDGNTAVSYDLDNPASPVPGPRFGGNSSVGAAFIAGTGWPQGYQGSYFIADYAAGWLRRVEMDPSNKALAVHNFGTNLGAIVCIGEGADGAIWYVRYETGQIRKISPIGYTNLPPVAVAEQDVLYGPGPLTVQFSGSNSSDPENGPLSYLWDFGDGTTSTNISPSHTFNAPVGVPTVFTVTLTVMDDENQANTATVKVNVNNTPPVVSITSFPDGQLYPVGADTTVVLQADASDAESPLGELTFAWQTILHHNIHIHPEPIDNAVSTSTVISGVGCYGDPFHYVVALTVTDPGGLSTVVTHSLYPNCAGVKPSPLIRAEPSQAMVPFTSQLDGLGSVDNGTIVSYEWDFGDGTFANGAEVSKTFTETGDHQVKLTVTDDDGHTATALKVVSGYEMGPPQCVGPTGSVLREYWTGISGAMIGTMLQDPRYPDSPTGTSYPSSISIPVNFANSYGTRVRGYIIPSTTGAHTFNVTADDVAVFYLSENAEPALKRVLCEVPAYTNFDQYYKYPSQQSSSVQLVAGQYYYFEVLHKENTSGDHMTVRWTQPGNPTLTEISGNNIAAWADCGPGLRVRMALDGPFDPATGLMNDDLRAKGLLPLQEPYTALGYTMVGGGGETVSAAMFDVEGKNAVVDWVLLELRAVANMSTIVASQPALLQRDGDVVGVDGRPLVLFNVAAGSYYVAARHRNHLGAMTAAPVRVDHGGLQVDFTWTGQETWGTTAQKELKPGTMGLWGGNALRDAVVKYTGSGNDRDVVLLKVGGMVPTATLPGYHIEDLNMNGLVSYTGSNNDRELILLNIGGSNPLVVLNEQLP